MARLIMIVGLMAVVLPVVPASAQGVRCSAFLHEHDGSWRSFEPGLIIGPRGQPIRVETGDRFRRGASPNQAFIARLLDGVCRPE